MASSVSGQDESNPVLWLTTRVSKMELSCPLGTTRPVPQEKFPRKPYDKSFIDQACSVKTAGYWPCSFFASLWTSTPSRSINTQRRSLANVQPSWPHTWSITHIYRTAYILIEITHIMTSKTTDVNRINRTTQVWSNCIRRHRTCSDINWTVPWKLI